MSPKNLGINQAHNCDLRKHPTENPIMNTLLDPSAFPARDYVIIHQYLFVI